MTTKLELRKQDFFPRLVVNETLTFRRLSAAAHRFAAFLWQEIGANSEEDRRGWQALQWQNYLADPRCEFYGVFCDDEPAGCAELLQQPRLMRASSTVRIKAIGLFPEYSDEGLGAALLTRMVEKSLAAGAETVTLRSGEALDKATLTLFRRQGFKELSAS